MRSLILSTCLLLAIQGLEKSAHAQKDVDMVIENGHIVDGSGRPRYQGDIAIKAGRIVSVGNMQSVKAKQRIDATGKIVAPGFVDSHSHTGSYMLDAKNRLNESALTQGISTIIFGADGDYSPRTLQQMLQTLQAQGTGTNIGFYVGHNGIRKDVLKKDQRRKASPEEIRRMANLVREGMQMGAIGFSTGLMYEPGTYSDTEEVIELAKVVAEYGGVYDSHVRDPARALLASDKEVIDVGAAAGVAAKIAHIKAVCMNNAGKTEEIISMVNAARAAGQNVVTDQYPYTGAKTVFLRDIFLTRDSTSVEDLRKRLLNANEREKIRQISEQGIDGGFSWIKATGYNCIRITHSLDFPEYQGKYLAEIAQMENSTGFDTAAELIISARHDVRITLGGVDEQDVQSILVQPWNMIVTDGKYINEKSSPRQHPRSTGTFTKILRKYVRELGLLTLEQAIAKMTAEPADFLGLSDRGRIAAGKVADIVIFDEAEILDRSNWAAPLLYSTGIQYLLVNGKVAVREGVVLEQPYGVLVTRTHKTPAKIAVATAVKETENDQ